MMKVKVTMREVVRAALPMQEKHWLPLTNLDMLLPPIDVSVVFCYKHDNDNDNDNVCFKEKVKVLRRALAEALVPFYAFSGEIVTNFAGEPELLCNNRGVPFIQAFADVNLSYLDFHDADHCLSVFTPATATNRSVLSVQVTELKCGAIMVGCTFHHQVADAWSANMFWVVWSEMATYKPVSRVPCFRRSLLNHRHPTQYNPSLDSMYLTTNLNSLLNHKTQSNIVSRIYYIVSQQLCQLQSSLVTNAKTNNNVTKFQSFCAFLWKLVASHACQNGTQNSSKLCKMGIVVDGRTRLSKGENQHKKEALASYFGNVLSIPFGEEECLDLKDMPLKWVANRVQNALEPALKKEHFLGLIDWVEAHKPGLALSRIYSSGNEDGPAFVVSSGLNFPISEVDFGWGKPVFGSYHFPWEGNCGYVMPMPSPKGNGDWVLYMQLLQTQLDFIEANAPQMFMPFSMDFICS